MGAGTPVRLPESPALRHDGSDGRSIQRRRGYGQSQSGKDAAAVRRPSDGPVARRRLGGRSEEESARCHSRTGPSGDQSQFHC